MHDVLNEFKEYLVVDKHMSTRTMLAYVKDVEKFLNSMYTQEIAIPSLTEKDVLTFLQQLRDSVISTPLYSQVISALKLFCHFLHEKYKLPIIVLEKFQANTHFPLVCTDKEIQQVVSGLGTSFEDMRIALIIRLLYNYKITLKQLPSLHWSISGISLDGEPIKLLGHDSTLLMNYKKALSLQLPLSIHSNYLFAVKNNMALKPISQQAIWSLLKKVFSGTREQWFMTRRSVNTQETPYHTKHPRGS